MAKPREFSAVDPHVLSAHMPSGHPAVEDQRLTLFQQQALPALLWFFDLERNRATGRSHLMAHVLIELAMRGQKVVLEDLSAAAQDCYRGHHGRPTRFAATVLGLAQTVYAGHYFDYDHGQNTLRYRGRRPL